jgi:hypothetical protein
VGYEVVTKQSPHPELVTILAFQPALRPALPLVTGPLDYRAQRQLFERIDAIIAESRLDTEFLTLALQDQGFDPAKATAKHQAKFAQFSFVCLRANIARKLTGLAHREFCRSHHSDRNLRSIRNEQLFEGFDFRRGRRFGSFRHGWLAEGRTQCA